MAIDDELKAQILRYHFVEHWRVGTIASQLGVHHSTVERVLGEAGVERERQRPRRPSKLDSYMAFITETLERFPTLSAARLFDMVKARGYTGGPDHFRHRIAQLRPRRPREAYLRLRTLASEQAQVDWAHFGKLTIGRAERPLMAFVVVLSYSRYPFVRFYLGASLANLKEQAAKRSRPARAGAPNPVHHEGRVHEPSATATHRCPPRPLRRSRREVDRLPPPNRAPDGKSLLRAALSLPQRNR